MPQVQLRREPKRQPLSLGGVEFAPDSVLEEGGFELVCDLSCQVVVFGLLPVFCSERESRSLPRRLDLGNIAVYTTKPAERVTTLEIQVTCYAAESHDTIHLPLSWKRWPEGQSMYCRDPLGLSPDWFRPWARSHVV
jgi:hypothetical protein